MSTPRIGLIAIGRNEGERLKNCLRSVSGRVERIVYVDSASTDDSVAFARALGVAVVELDKDRPFTAAWARNNGFHTLMQLEPELEYVQFVDGDCVVVDGWLETAAQALDRNPQVAVVCGRRRERFPHASAYNLMCDIEWDTPVGEATACGGDAMMRTRAFAEVGMFDAGMIAGEEPELCVRLREANWKILRLDAEMTLHDAAMTRFSQWWKRMERAGHAYAEGAAMHGRGPTRHNVRELLSIAWWGLCVPTLGFVFALLSTVLPWFAIGAALVALAYIVLGLRVYRHRRRMGDDRHRARIYAAFTVLAKVPLLLGAGSFFRHALRGQRRLLIEYK